MSSGPGGVAQTSIATTSGALCAMQAPATSTCCSATCSRCAATSRWPPADRIRRHASIATQTSSSHSHCVRRRRTGGVPAGCSLWAMSCRAGRTGTAANTTPTPTTATRSPRRPTAACSRPTGGEPTCLTGSESSLTMYLVMTPAVRMTAEDRRADVLRMAVAEFAKHGFEGTSTEDVARAAGISQPYLFKMFPTKKALFLSLVEHGFARVRQAFTDAVGDRTGDEALEAMGAAYGELLRDRDELMLQLQAYAACEDNEIGEVTRREFGRLWREVARLSGADEEVLQTFFAMGMLMNVIAAMDATNHPSQWVKECVKPAWLNPPVRSAS